MENLGHKKNTCEEKNISRQKWLRKMHLKDVEFTYKSQILKFKIQQKVFNLVPSSFLEPVISINQLRVRQINFKCLS